MDPNNESAEEMDDKKAGIYLPEMSMFLSPPLAAGDRRDVSAHESRTDLGERNEDRLSSPSCLSHKPKSEFSLHAIGLYASRQWPRAHNTKIRLSETKAYP